MSALHVMALRAVLESDEAAAAVIEAQALFPWPLCTLTDALAQHGRNDIEDWLEAQGGWYWTEAVRALRLAQFSPPAPSLPVVLGQLAKLDQARDEHMGREAGAWFGPKPPGMELDEVEDAEARCPEQIQELTHLERDLHRQVYSYGDIADLLTQARQEARDYPEAVETRQNRTGALRKALAGREWDSGRTYRAPVFRPMPEVPEVTITREQWEAIDALDADLLAQTMGLARVRGGIECPLHKGDHEAKVYRSRRGPMHWQCFRSDQGGGALELYAAMVRGGIPTDRDQRRAVAAEMVARGLV